MGYYSTFEYELSKDVKFDSIDNTNYDIAKRCDSGFSDAEIKLTSDGYEISVYEYTQKFYDDQEFAEVLADHLTQGKIILYFSGEDGANWGYYIYPGLIKELIWTSHEGEIIYESKRKSDK